MDKDLYRRVLAGAMPHLEETVQGAGFWLAKPEQYDSPIEYAMAVAMHVLTEISFPHIHHLSLFGETDDQCARYVLTAISPSSAAVFPQVRIGRFVVDFFVAYDKGDGTTGGIVIECDGHDFHEKTKEQAAHDKARDRDLQSRGYRVFRFTGSEIHRDPVACVYEAFIVVACELGNALIARSELRAIAAAKQTVRSA